MEEGPDGCEISYWDFRRRTLYLFNSKELQSISKEIWEFVFSRPWIKVAKNGRQACQMYDAEHFDLQSGEVKNPF